MTDTEYPRWMEKADVGTVAVLTLDDGECLTVDVRGFDDERDELVVDVVSSTRTHPHHRQRSRSIPIRSVISFEPRPRTAQPWPYSDPCRGTSFSFARFVLMATLFLSWTVGSFPLVLFIVAKPSALPVVLPVWYTIYVVFFTFARIGTRTGKDLPPYLFSCPAVRTQLPRLLWRHLGFLIVLFAIQTLARGVRPNLPAWWNTDSGGVSPFGLGLIILCAGILLAQVLTNRRLLDKAHH